MRGVWPRIQEQLRQLPLFSPETSSQLRTWQWLALIGGVGAFFLPVTSLGFSVCFFYNLSGVPCPGCGMTRSVHLALHLQPMHALYHHPMGLLAAVMIIYFCVTAVWRPAGRLFEAYKQHSAVVIVVLALGILSFGLVRALWVIGTEPAERVASPWKEFGVVAEDRRLFRMTR